MATGRLVLEIETAIRTKARCYDSVNERAFSEKGFTNCSKFGAEKLRGENERTNDLDAIRERYA